MLRRPIVVSALLFALGTYLGVTGSLKVLVAIPALSLAATTVLLSFKRGWTNLAFYPGVLLLAVVYAYFSGPGSSRSTIANLMQNPSEYLELRGTVSYQPVCYATSSADAGRVCYFDLHIDSVRRTSEWTEVNDQTRVRLYLPKSAEPIRYGDRLELGGVLSLAGEGESYRRSGESRLNALTANMKILSSGNGSPIIRLCLNLRATAGRLFQSGLESYPRQAGLLKALLLGQREELDGSIHDNFMKTGTVHILAISGLHVGLIAFFITYFLRWIGVPRTRWYLVVIPLLSLYTIGTGMRASAIRACLMAAIYLLAPPLKKKPNALCALALSAIIILIVAPEQILEPGFQFSFTIVAGMLIILPSFNEMGFALSRPDPLKIESEATLLRWSRAGLGRLYFMLVVSLVAWLVSTPLAMYYANIFSPISVIANLFVVPLISFVVGIGVLTMMFGGFLPLIAIMLNNVNRMALTVLMHFVASASQVPYGVVYTRTPGAIFMVSYYVVLLGAFFLRRTRHRLIIATALPILIGAHILMPPTHMARLEVRDAGKAPVSLLKLKGNSALLVNTGPEYFGRELTRWLRARSVNRIDLLLLTQVDQTHAGGLDALLANFHVDRIGIPDHESRSRLMVELRRIEASSGVGLERFRAGDVLELKHGFRVQFYNPIPGQSYHSGEDACSVFRVAGGDFGAMFVGGRINRSVFDQARDLAAPVWVMDGYGSRDAQVLREVLHYHPKLLICGGEIRPPAEAGVETWLLRQRGSYILEHDSRP